MKTKHYLRLSITVLTIILLALIFIYALNLQSNASLFLLFCTGASLILTLVLVFSRSLNLHNPLIYILLTVVIGVTIRGHYMVFFSERFDVQRLFLTPHDISYYILPSILIFVSMLLFVIGYSFTNKPFRFNSFSLYNDFQVWNQNRLYLLAIIFTVISIAGIYLFISSMGIVSILADISSKRFVNISGSEYKGSLGYLRLMANFMMPAFFIMFVHYLINKKRLISIDGFFLIILGVLNLFFSFFTSSRGGVVFFILNMLVVLSIYKKVNIKTLIFSALFASIIFSALTILRSSRTQEVKYFDVALLEPIILNQNLLDISVTSRIINEVPQKLDYQYGATFLSIFVAPIPRNYWPEKPPVNPGKTVYRELYIGNDNQKGIPPGIIGELYINYGILGICVGLILVGIFIKKIYLYFNFDKKIRKNKVILFVAFIMNFTVVLFGGSINQALIGFGQDFVLIHLGLMFISQRLPHKQRL